MNQKEIDDMVKDAKKILTVEEIKDAVKRCSYGGKAIGMSLKEVGEIINGKTNT